MRRFWIIFGVLLLLLIVLRLPIIQKEYVPEDQVWVTSAETIKEVGYPAYQGGRPGQLIPWDQAKGPFYAFLLAGGYSLFGQYEWVARGIPLLFLIAQIFLVVILSRTLFGKNLGDKVSLVTSAFLALHPFFIQGSVHIDVDVIVGLFVLSSLLFAWRLYIQNDLHVFNALGFAFSIAGVFVNRFDIAILLVGSLFLFALLQKKYELSIVLLSIAGATVFTCSLLWVCYASYTGNSAVALKPFLRLIETAQVHTDSGSIMADRMSRVFPESLRSVSSIVTPLFPFAAFSVIAFTWLTAPLVFLVLFSLGLMIRNRRLLTPEFYLLLIPAALFIFTFSFLTQIFTFPRYLHSGLVLLIMATSGFIFKKFEDRPDSVSIMRLRLAPWVLGSLVLVLLLVFTPASALLTDQRILSSPLLSGGLLFMTIVFTLFALWKFKKDSHILIVLFLATSLMVIFGVAINARDFRKPYALTSYYGNYGFEEAGRFLKETVRPGEMVLASDAVGFYYDQPFFFASEPYYAALEPRYIAVFRIPAHPTDNLISGKTMIAKFGTVEIYDSTRPSP